MGSSFGSIFGFTLPTPPPTESKLWFESEVESIISDLHGTSTLEKLPSSTSEMPFATPLEIGEATPLEGVEVPFEEGLGLVAWPLEIGGTIGSSLISPFFMRMPTKLCRLWLSFSTWVVGKISLTSRVKPETSRTGVPFTPAIFNSCVALVVYSVKTPERESSSFSSPSSMRFLMKARAKLADAAWIWDWSSFRPFATRKSRDRIVKMKWEKLPCPTGRIF